MKDFILISLAFAIALNYELYSLKTITLFKNNVYKIHNHIDGTTQKLAPYQMWDDQFTNVTKAIDLKALYLMD